MALFTKNDPATKIASGLETAVGKQHDLEKRLRLAEAKVVEQRNAAHALARDAADDTKLDAAEAALRASQDRVTTLNAALVDIKKDVADLQAKAAKIADDKLRIATDAAIKRIATDLVEAGAVYEAAATKLTVAARRASDIVLDAHGLVAYSMSTSAEIPAAISMIVEVLNHRAAQTLNGSAPAALPMPEQIAAKPKAVEAPSLECVFLLKHLKFVDANGQLRRLPKMNAAHLSKAHAARALKFAWAISMSDSRVKQLGGTYGSQIPAAHLCEDLDSGMSSNAEPIMASSPFERIDRGGPIYGAMRTTQQPTPMAATRTLPTDK